MFAVRLFLPMGFSVSVCQRCPFTWTVLLSNNPAEIRCSPDWVLSHPPIRVAQHLTILTPKTYVRLSSSLPSSLRDISLRAPCGTRQHGAHNSPAFCTLVLVQVPAVLLPACLVDMIAETREVAKHR